ncbi:MAG: type II toxin-antitoxin system HicA family toxin [Bacteroidales bacterium]|nr:type II toxin-antitoxin system HicA family toxin [Bacteroidales bacterium]
MKVREVIDILEKEGWRYVSTKGDHHKFFKAGARRPIIVAGKGSDDLALATLNSIMREAKIVFCRKK